MKLFLISLFTIVLSCSSQAQALYIKTFGNVKDKPLIFLHGGPGYNCASFEATTAERLANEGFYVIVYDRRGEGRSDDKKANYTFQETFDDLNAIYKTFDLKKATLIGHSFGGIVATLFADKYPNQISSLVYVGAPVSLQESFRTIINSCKQIYQSKNDSVNLNYMNMLDNMDTTSLMYSTYCFGHAMANGFYSTKNPSEATKKMYATFKTDTLLKNYASKMTYEGPQGFWKNEKYTCINLTTNIKNLLAKKIKIYGLYGKEDGLYSKEQISSLLDMIGHSNLKYLDNCSHSVYIDQQEEFISSVKLWAR